MCIAVLAMGSGQADAQEVSHLPPEKAAVVVQMAQEMLQIPVVQAHLRGANYGQLKCAPEIYNPEVGLSYMHPMLVGRNIIFAKQWLQHVGPGRPMSEQQFEAWRNKIDGVYDSYSELVGRGASYGHLHGKPHEQDHKVYVNIEPRTNFTNSTVLGHSHATIGKICLNQDYITRRLPQIAATGSWDYVMMHELAHQFEKSANWSFGESSVDHLIAYALETTPGSFHMGRSGNQKISGRQHRDQLFAKAVAAHRSGKAILHDARDIYLLGLVGKIGWDTYKKVFRSYENEPFYYSTWPTKNREFLNRLEQNSGVPILRSLPDRGALLDKFFTASGPYPVTQFAQTATPARGPIVLPSQTSAATAPSATRVVVPPVGQVVAQTAAPVGQPVPQRMLTNNGQLVTPSRLTTPTVGQTTQITAPRTESSSGVQLPTELPIPQRALSNNGQPVATVTQTTPAPARAATAQATQTTPARSASTRSWVNPDLTPDALGSR